jgi:pteridine reductase
MAHTPVAIVTGCGKNRLGTFIAEALAHRGYRLVLPYLTSSRPVSELAARLQQQGAAAVAVQADLTDERSVIGLFETARHEFVRLDVLVTCAAIWQSKRLEDITADDVRRHFDANLLSTFLCCQHAGLAMVQQPEGGVIVTFGDWAICRPYLNYAAYFPSKGAVPTLTRCLAVELGTRNPRVRVNCIQPGPVLMPDEVDDDERRAVVRATLVGRPGGPEPVVQAVLYLVDNDFVTGECLTVDGGRTIFAGPV